MRRITSEARPLSSDNLGEYQESFRDPGNRWQCWFVHRETRRTKHPPRQCTQKRLAARLKGGEPQLCCYHHQKHEDEAKAYAKESACNKQ